MKYLLIIAFSFSLYTSLAQHEEHKREENEPGKKENHEGMEKTHDMKMGDMHDHEAMSSSAFIGVPMSMESSGTSWQPESAPMFMSMYHAGNWMINLHGDIKTHYNHQGGPRGEKAFSAPNWIMAGAHTKISDNAQFMIRTMLSADRLTEGGKGYSLLLQTGESWQGQPLVDRQHPHDLVGELAMGLSQKLGDDFTAYLYFGYPGEPALGPPAYLHRASAMPLPEAPLSHHWQDATHIVFGVGSLGFIYKRLKIEGSVFTGEEPDENRYNFDKPTFDSYSGRISFSPTEDITMQASGGLLKNAEEQGHDVLRSTASTIYIKNYSEDIFWANSLVWGMNQEDETKDQHSFLLESSFFFESNRIFMRSEFVQKPRKELGIGDDGDELEDIYAVSLGYSRRVLSIAGIDLDVGAVATTNIISSFLENYYGRNPFSYRIYLGIHPSLMTVNM